MPRSRLPAQTRLCGVVLCRIVVSLSFFCLIISSFVLIFVFLGFLFFACFEREDKRKKEKTE